MKQKMFKESHIPFNQFTPMMTSYVAMAEYQNQKLTDTLLLTINLTQSLLIFKV